MMIKLLLLLSTLAYIESLPNYAKDIHVHIKNGKGMIQQMENEMNEKRVVPKTFPPLNLKERSFEDDAKRFANAVKRTQKDRTYFENDIEDQMKKDTRTFPPVNKNSKRTRNDRTYFKNDLEEELTREAKTFPPLKQPSKRGAPKLELPKEAENAFEQIEVTNKEEHLDDLFQSDIKMQPDRDDEREMSLDEKLAKRNAIRDKGYLWPHRTVPYVITDSIGMSGARYDAIMAAMGHIESKTCIRFTERTTEKNYLSFVRLSGCWSYIGRLYYRPGSQNVSLGTGCQYKGTVVHELLHAIGFSHEQSRNDRDKYIEVMWENVLDGKDYNFKKATTSGSQNIVDYDYASIMHYGSHYFSKNGQATMRAIGQPSTTTFGQRDGMSVLDAIEVNTLYHCADSSTSASGWSEWSGWGPCYSGCYKRRQRFCTGTTADKDCEDGNENGIINEYSVCPPEECHAPLDGHWGRWQAWGSCTATCDSGTRSRKRECTDPAPANGGKECPPEGDTETSTCVMRSCNAGPYDTTFDDADWSDVWNLQVINGTGWYLNSGKTRSSYTGPDGDHTTGSEKYVYYEATGAKQMDQRSLYSVPLDPNGDKRCLSFWYNMYGEAIGSLNVYTYAPLKEVITITGNQGKEWKYMEKTIDAENELQVIFYAVRGMDFRGDIAIDDISFKEHACS